MAADVTSGLAVMKTGGSAADSLGAAAYAGMGPNARVIPLFAVHGMKDVVATPEASRNLVAQFAAIARAAGSPLQADSAAGTAGVATAGASGQNSRIPISSSIARWRASSCRVIACSS